MLIISLSLIFGSTLAPKFVETIASFLENIAGDCALSRARAQCRGFEYVITGWAARSNGGGADWWRAFRFENSIASLRLYCWSRRWWNGIGCGSWGWGLRNDRRFDRFASLELEYRIFETSKISSGDWLCRYWVNGHARLFWQDFLDTSYDRTLGESKGILKIWLLGGFFVLGIVPCHFESALVCCVRSMAMGCPARNRDPCDRSNRWSCWLTRSRSLATCNPNAENAGGICARAPVGLIAVLMGATMHPMSLPRYVVLSVAPLWRDFNNV